LLHSVSADFLSAACHFSGFQITGGDGSFISAATPAHPASPSISVLSPVQNSKSSENSSCQIFCHISSVGSLFPYTSTIFYGPSDKMSGVYQNFLSTVTNAPLILFAEIFHVTVNQLLNLE